MFTQAPRFKQIAVVAATAMLAFSVHTAKAQDVTGAGASFPAPVYAKWADAYNKATGVRINYQSMGASMTVSSAGNPPVTGRRFGLRK